MLGSKRALYSCISFKAYHLHSEEMWYHLDWHGEQIEVCKCIPWMEAVAVGYHKETRQFFDVIMKPSWLMWSLQGTKNKTPEQH